MNDLRTWLRKEESYAIHALIYVAENPGCSAQQLAQDLQMPAAFMAKIMRRLGQAEFIRSQMGRGGGMWLTVDPEQLNVFQIIEAMSGRIVMDQCQTVQRCITQERKGSCRLNGAWFRMAQSVRQGLSEVLLIQLMDPNSVGSQAIASVASDLNPI